MVVQCVFKLDSMMLENITIVTNRCNLCKNSTHIGIVSEKRNITYNRTRSQNVSQCLSVHKLQWKSEHM